MREVTSGKTEGGIRANKGRRSGAYKLHQSVSLDQFNRASVPGRRLLHRKERRCVYTEIGPLVLDVGQPDM